MRHYRLSNQQKRFFGLLLLWKPPICIATILDWILEQGGGNSVDSFGSVDFNRGWVEYEEGFGSLTDELWYGLRPLHCLTNQG